MEIHQLQYFCAVAQHGTFTRAALAQGVAQPSLSQQILKLEAELGARLFDRMPRRVRLTAFGLAFQPKAEQILRELGEAKSEILEMAGHEKGEVAIGVIPTIAPYLLPRVLNGFSREHPSIAIKVLEALTSALLDQLRDGAIDMAIVALPVPENKIRSVELFRESMFAALPVGHPHARRQTIGMNELKNEPFLLLKEGHCFRDSTIAACHKAHMNPKVVFESGQFSTILAMVSARMGVSAVPEMAVQPVEGCSFVRIAGDRSGRRVGAIMMRQHFETRAQRAFLDYLVKTLSRAKQRSANGKG